MLTGFKLYRIDHEVYWPHGKMSLFEYPESLKFIYKESDRDPKIEKSKRYRRKIESRVIEKKPFLYGQCVDNGNIERPSGWGPITLFDSLDSLCAFMKNGYKFDCMYGLEIWECKYMKSKDDSVWSPLSDKTSIKKLAPGTVLADLIRDVKRISTLR